METERYILKNGSAFAVAPEFGCNIFSWQVEGREMLYSPEGVPGDRERFYKGGNPILFPAVGRTWGKCGDGYRPEYYSIDGLDGEYRMPVHGILPFAGWEKVSAQVEEHCASAEYRCSIPPDAREHYYPFDILFSLIYTLTDRSLSIAARFANEGSTAAPLAFGCHPYFALPGNARQEAELYLPCSRRLQLDPERLVPTGATAPAAFPLRLERDAGCDAVFSGLSGSRASLVNSAAGHAVHIDFDAGIEMLVVYSPAGSSFICLEPWTRGLGAYETLRHPGWREGGALNVLQPGESRSIRLRYSVEDPHL